MAQHPSGGRQGGEWGGRGSEELVQIVRKLDWRGRAQRFGPVARGLRFQGRIVLRGWTSDRSVLKAVTQERDS